MSDAKREYVSFNVTEKTARELKKFMVKMLSEVDNDELIDVLVDVYVSLKYTVERFEEKREEEKNAPRLGM